MKSIMNIQRLLAAAILSQTLLQSCTSQDETSGSQPLTLTVECCGMATDRAETRAATYATASQDAAFISGKTVRIYATNTSASGGLVYTVESNGMLTPPDPKKPPYYPASGTIDIKGYYPSTVTSTTTSFEVSGTQTSSDAYQTSDLMTVAKSGQALTASAVSLQFKHRMARINLSVTATDGLTVQSISLMNVKRTASYTASTDKWAASGSSSTITVATGGTGATLSGVALFPAQSLASTGFIQVVTDRGTALYSVTKEFQEGHAYTTALEVGLNSLTTTTEVTDWTKGGTEANPGTIFI